MLAIPYLRPGPDGEFTCSIRFRCIEDHDHVGHGKYQTVPGDRGRMFNTAALLSGSDVIGITEGELDAVMAEASGIPSVGIPGAQHWKQHYRGPFQGYDVVYVFSDGDEPGHALAKTVMKDLANAKHIPMPDGHDVSSAVVTRGLNYLKERIK